MKKCFSYFQLLQNVNLCKNQHILCLRLVSFDPRAHTKLKYFEILKRLWFIYSNDSSKTECHVGKEKWEGTVKSKSSSPQSQYRVEVTYIHAFFDLPQKLFSCLIAYSMYSYFC